MTRRDNRENRRYYDQTKDLLGKVRDLQEVEDVEEGGYKVPTQDEYDEEKKKFKDNVAGQVDFPEREKFKIYEDNVEWKGMIQPQEIQWIYSLDDNEGVYITTDAPLQLREQDLEILQNLRDYYDVWREYWVDVITGEE